MNATALDKLLDPGAIGQIEVTLTEDRPMSQTLARLFSVLTTLERRYGLAGMDPDERAIFGFIVGEIAAGRRPTMQDVLAEGLTSRSTAYRKVANLKGAGLVEQKRRGDGEFFALSPRLRGFGSSLKGFVSVGEGSR